MPSHPVTQLPLFPERLCGHYKVVIEYNYLVKKVLAIFVMFVLCVQSAWGMFASALPHAQHVGEHHAMHEHSATKVPQPFEQPAQQQDTACFDCEVCHLHVPAVAVGQNSVMPSLPGHAVAAQQDRTHQPWLNATPYRPKWSSAV
jgi:hypothetical protein